MNLIANRKKGENIQWVRMTIMPYVFSLFTKDVMLMM